MLVLTRKRFGRAEKLRQRLQNERQGRDDRARATSTCHGALNTFKPAVEARYLKYLSVCRKGRNGQRSSRVGWQVPKIIPRLHVEG